MPINDLKCTPSGSHPFDYDAAFGSSDNWINHVEDSREPESSQFSQKYINGEMRLKERIIHGAVDFATDPWDELPEGMSLPFLTALIVIVFQRKPLLDAY